MIRLATLDCFLAVNSARRQFVGPVHPINACIDMALIGRSNLENARDPFIIVYFEAIFTIVLELLMFDYCLVGNKDEALAIVLDAINC